MLSCFTNSYGRFGPEAAFEWLPKAGIRFVELAIKNHGVPSFFRETPILTEASTPSDVARVQRLLDEAGLRLSSCNVSCGNVLDPALVERTIRKLDLVQTLGVDRVVSGGGEAKSAAEEQQLWTHLRRIGDAAAKRGITYCCETHPGSCQNAESMLQTMQAVDHPHIRLNFDTGNLYYYNRDVNLEQSLRQVLPYVEHVHLKETPGGFEQWHFVELGSGVVDFRMIREVLESANYAGPYSLELEGIKDEPDPTLPQHHQRVVDSISHLRSCGYDN
ncbi:MAG: sugar phosphate isomerase/epimerase family protein [Planctomycetaceae bacterium]